LLNALGRAIGSIYIDMKTHRLLVERLEKMPAYLAKPPREIAYAMIGDKLETFKFLYGTDMSAPTLYLDVPGLPPGIDFPDAGVLNSQMIIRRQEAPSARMFLE